MSTSTITEYALAQARLSGLRQEASDGRLARSVRRSTSRGRAARHTTR